MRAFRCWGVRVSFLPACLHCDYPALAAAKEDSMGVTVTVTG